MKYDNNNLILSPSDLTTFMASPFASWMERFSIENPSNKQFKSSEDPVLKLLQNRGNEHEKEYLKQLKAHYGEDQVTCLEESKPANSQFDFENTLSAIKKGTKVIFQAYLKRDNFHGYADFLFRVDDESAPNGFYYEVWDTKLSKKVKPYFLVQLCAYSWMLEKMQGVLPQNTRVVLGNMEEPDFLIAQHYDYFLTLKQQFLTFQDDFENDDSNCPDPALISDYGRWSEAAKTMLQNSDSLALVANMRKTQIKYLRAKGINTLTELAECELPNISGINQEIYAKLRIQAHFQLESRKRDEIQYKVIESDQGKGLSALPKEHELDVFFDIEGNPLNEGGLEYLWGISLIQADEPQGKKYQFKDWWGHTPELEKEAFIDFVGWIYERWCKSDKKMHIYHYASYEVTALKKLSDRHQVYVNEVKELINTGALVDLYKIVRNGMIIGEPKYSIKNVEKLYRPKRNTEEDVSSGSESIVEYENWLELGGFEQWQTVSDIHWPKKLSDIAWQEPSWKKIKAIRDYNIDDCESTLELVEFLRGITPEKIKYQSPPEIIKDEDEELAKKKAELSEFRIKQQVIIRLLEGYLKDNEDNPADSKIAQGLLDVLQFHYREYKAQVFESYLLKEKSFHELIDDAKALVASAFLSEEPFIDQKGNKKVKLTFAFDAEQTIRTDSLNAASEFSTDLSLSSGQFSASIEGSEEIDRVVYQAKPSEWNQVKEQLLNSTVIFIYRPESFYTINLEERLCDHAMDFLDKQQQNKLITALIQQQTPVFIDNKTPLPVNKDDKNRPLLDDIFQAVSQMTSSCLSIQGPPGTGKTYTASYLIKRLLANNSACRIGITSNSNKAIINLFNKVLKDTKGQYKTAYIGSSSNYSSIKDVVDKSFLDKCAIRNNFSFPQKVKNNKGKQLNEMRVFASTSFKFANSIFTEPENQLDYLFVDEAGQFALANLLAVTGVAKNIVLLGDQMQLEQTVQAAHPGIAGISSLQHVLNNERVVPSDKGVFLGCSYRMHQDVCKPLSSAVYQNELYSDEMNQCQKILWHKDSFNKKDDKRQSDNKEHGIQFIGVDHQGNSLESKEELVVVEKLIQTLLKSQYIEKPDAEAEDISEPKRQRVTEHDILVVSPYNQQVNLLKEKLNKEDKYPNLQIGTVDKFQGQEAQVVIYSMAASNLSDSSRGIGFLLSINRLNVAVSRAKTLAIIVSSDQLIDVAPNTIEQMRQLNLYCALVGHDQAAYKEREQTQNTQNKSDNNLSNADENQLKKQAEQKNIESSNEHAVEAQQDNNEPIINKQENSVELDKPEQISPSKGNKTIEFNDESVNSTLQDVNSGFKPLFIEMLEWLEQEPFYSKLDWGIANHSDTGVRKGIMLGTSASKPNKKTGKRAINEAMVRLYISSGSSFGFKDMNFTQPYIPAAHSDGVPMLVLRTRLVNYLRANNLVDINNTPQGFDWVFFDKEKVDNYALIVLLDSNQAFMNAKNLLTKISNQIRTGGI